MNAHIIPTQSQQVSKAFYKTNIGGWKNFAQRITKNPFVKRFLLERDGNKCSWCTKRMITSLIIHHTSYDHQCTYNIVKRVDAPTEHRPFKTRLVPDCESCKENNSAIFLACMDKLVLVHNSCNKAIAETNLNLPTKK